MGIQLAISFSVVIRINEYHSRTAWLATKLIIAEGEVISVSQPSLL